MDSTMKYPNEIVWAMTGNIRYTDNGNAYGDCARVYVNGEERYVVGVRDNWDRMCHVTMFTRITDTGFQVASFHAIPGNMHANITEMSQALMPLSDSPAYIPPF